MFNVSIPKISDADLAYWYARIKPVVKHYGKLYYLREFSFKELRSTSYLWNVPADIRDEVREDELKTINGENFMCLHKFGYYGYFKPTIAEVLSQIDKALLPQIKAFEITTFPGQVYDFDAASLSSIAYRQGYQVSIVKLYKARD